MSLYMSLPPVAQADIARLLYMHKWGGARRGTRRPPCSGRLEQHFCARLGLGVYADLDVCRLEPLDSAG